MSSKEYSIEALNNSILYGVDDSESVLPQSIDIELSESEKIRAKNEDELLQMTFKEFDSFLRPSTLHLSTDIYMEHKGTADSPIATTSMINYLLKDYDLKEVIIFVNYDLFGEERNQRAKFVEISKTFAIVEAWELLALNSDSHGARKHAQETAMIHTFSHAQELGLLEEYLKFLESAAKSHKDKKEKEDYLSKIKHAHCLFTKNSRPQKSDYNTTLLKDLRESRK